VSRLSPGSNLLLLFVVVNVCTALLLVQPREVIWNQTPSLTLPVEPVLAALAAEAKSASQAPDTPAAVKLDALWLAHGRAIRDGIEPTHVRLARRPAMQDAPEVVFKESRDPSVLALRAAPAERLEAALDIKLDPAVAKDVLGDFALMLEGEGCARDGELIAPRFVVRTLYKARWNIAYGLPPPYALNNIEQRAYYGLQALHGERLPIEQRMAALVTYARIGGTRANEAAGVLLHRSQQPRIAAGAFQMAYDIAGTLRLRNALLAQADESSDAQW